MDTNHYKQRPGETNATMAARALGVKSAKDLDTLFRPYVLVGRNQETVSAYQDSRNPDRIAAVATSTGSTDRATVSTMTRKEWESAYDRAFDRSGTAGNESGDAHFVSALMEEVGGKYPGRGNDRWDSPSEEFQPRAPGRIKAAAAAAKAAEPKAPKAKTADRGDER